MMKRVFDIVASFCGLVALSPVLLVIVALIKASSAGSVFFCQTRVGRGGKLFRIYKFRTMIPQAEQHGDKITVGNDKRITPIGAFLRKTKLDELPQLFNVLKGDMSVVGPRPEVPEFVAEHPEDIRKIILSVRPGITDTASIEFSDEAGLLGKKSDPRQAYIDEILPLKAEHYLRYAKNNSFCGDLHIIWATLCKVCKQAAE